MNKHHNLWISIIAVSTLVFIVTLLSITGTRAAQELQGAPSTDGDLDMTFGSGGIASTPFYLPAQSIGYASVLQGDGKLLVGGSSGDAVDSELNNFSIARYNTDGTPDNSFGRGGTVETDFAYQEDRIEGLAVQSDGKIIAAGFARMNCCSGYEDFALARYNTNGSLDTSFSGDGKVNTDIGGAGDIVYDVKVQSDGKIVVAGTANDHFTLARYNTDGSLDTSFGNGGIATAVMGSQDLALSLAIQSDGKLVVAGDVFLSSNPSDLGVARFNPDGTPDNTFSGDGKLLTDINGGYDAANGIAVQPVDGRIVVVGSSEDSGNTTESAVVVRYNTDGTLDTSFDGDGIVTTDLGGYSSFSSVAIQSNNMIVAAGKNNDGFADTVALARYTATGALDTGFDTDGIVLTTFGNTSSDATRLLIRPNGTLIATGTASANDMKPISGYAVAQYNPNGSLDTSFSGDGKLIAFNLHSDAALSKVALQTDGKIVAAGTASYNIALARYNTNGALDPTFGTGGVITTTGSLTTTSISALGLTLQSDGKIVTIGTAVDGGGPSVVLARYNTNGSLDTTFGDGGFASIYMQANYTSSVNVTQQADGKLVALFGNYAYHAMLVRYLANGTLDATFGNGGIVEDNFGSNSSFHDLAVQSDGKILITGAGTSQNPAGQDIMVARYLTNGAPDPAFGTSGHVLIDFGSDYEEAYAMAIQPDGKILAGGYSNLFSTGYAWAMARVNTNGTLDTTFNGDGKLTFDFADGNSSILYSLKLLPDGRIIGGGNESARIARFNSDGSIDPSFGTGGFVQNAAFYTASSIAIQSDNKILAGADTYTPYTDKLFAVARYLNSLTTVTPTVIPSATPTTCAVGWNYVPWVGETGMRTMNGVKAWAADNVWAAGTSNTDTQVLHWDGAQWSIIPSPDVPDKVDTLEFIDGSSPSDMWAVGNSFDSFTGQTDPLAIHWDGAQWSMSTLPAVNFADLKSVKSISANDAWAVGYSGGTPYQTFALHWNGSIWSIVTTPTPPGNTGSSFSGVSAYSSSDVWAVGYSMLSGLSVTLTEHWNGSAWSIVDGANVASRNNNLTGVTVIGPNDAWAVGNSAALQVEEGLIPPTESLLIHWDGTSWSRVSSPNPASVVFMTGISAISSDNVWAVGFTYENGIGNTVTLRWNGSTWQDVVSPNPSALTDNLWAVSAISSDDVWAVGEFGAQSGGSQLLALHYQTCVTPSPSATAPTATMTSTSTPTSNATSTQTITGTPPTSISTTTPTETAVISVTSTITALTSTPVNTATPTTCAISFEDVPVGSTFYLYIECMACRGIINSYPCGGPGEPCNGNNDPYFRPGNNVTRGQFAKITSNAAGFNETPGAQQYEDVAPGSTFYDYIWRLCDRGYVNGYPCGGAGEPCGPGNLPYFRPNSNITRGQIAKIDSNAAGYNDTPGDQQYEDVLPGSTFYDFIWRLANRGLVNGYPCGGTGEPCGPSNLPYFRPSANATRGQASKIVSNTFFPACNVSIR